MAWSRKKVDSATINDGNEYVKGSRVSRQNLNAMVNSGLYAQDFAEKLVTNIDTSEIGGTGTPSVTLIAGDGATAEKPYKKFKFSNLKGEKGDQGDTGSQGIQGVKGVIGATPNISVAATTLAAGSQATATRSGTDESPIITFGIPKGDSGSNGYSILYSNRSDTSSTTEYISKDSMTMPSGYTVKVGDMILCLDGNLFRITSIATSAYGVSYLTSLKGSSSGGITKETIKLPQLPSRVQSIGAEKITQIEIEDGSSISVKASCSMTIIANGGTITHSTGQANLPFPTGISFYPLERAFSSSGFYNIVLKSSKYELTINGDLFGLNITLKPQDNWETIDSEMRFYKYSAWDITALNNTTLNNLDVTLYYTI